MNQVFIGCADFYPDISQSLLSSCLEVLSGESIEYDVGGVSGCLELPGLIANKEGSYCGYIALGCIIRGETIHYEIVSREASRGLMDLCVHRNMLIVNGILSVENMAQAEARVGKGSFCAKALMRLMNEVRA